MQINMIARGTSLTIAVALLASSCGGSTQAEVASELEPTDEVVATTTEAVTTTASPVDVDRYCELTILNEAKEDAFFDGAGPADPAKLEAFMVEVQESITEAIEVADPVIKADVILMQERLSAFAELMESVEYDIALATNLEEPTSPEWTAAEEAVDAYEEEVCGLGQDGDDVEDAEPTGEIESAGGVSLEDAEIAVALMETEAGLALVVDGFISEVPGVSVDQAECFLKSLTPEQFVSFAEIGQNPDSIDPADPALSEVLTILDTCNIPLTALLPSS